MRDSVLTISNVLQLAMDMPDLDVICMWQKEAFHIG